MKDIDIGFQFGYSFESFTIPANDTQSRQVNIDSDWNFVMDSIMGRIVENAAPTNEADALIQFTDSTTTKTWFTRPTLQQLILADARNINPPIFKRTVKKQSQVTLEVQNLTANIIRVDVMLRGMKLDPAVPQVNAQDSNRPGEPPALLADSKLPVRTPQQGIRAEDFSPQ